MTSSMDIEQIDKVKEHKSPGIDVTPIKFVIETAEQCSVWLITMSNLSLNFSNI